MEGLDRAAGAGWLGALCAVALDAACSCRLLRRLRGLVRM